MRFQIYSSYDGWEIQVIGDKNSLLETWAWDHEDFENGVGGEVMFADILEWLGYSIYKEEVC